MSTISSAVLRDDTIIRLGGDGGSGFLTWTSDDRQLATLLDGSSWRRDRGPFWHSRRFALHGRPEEMEAEEVETYPGRRVGPAPPGLLRQRAAGRPCRFVMRAPKFDTKDDTLTRG
jgi:hypothetical protein